MEALVSEHPQYQNVIRPIVMYAAETWCLRGQEETMIATRKRETV
jgi:hypothetical protein